MQGAAWSLGPPETPNSLCPPTISALTAAQQLVGEHLKSGQPRAPRHSGPPECSSEGHTSLRGRQLCSLQCAHLQGSFGP